MSHFLYALGAAASAPPYCSFLKIGHSSDPDRRMVSHRIGSPIPLRYAAIWRVRNDTQALLLEGACHKHFKPVWRHGEWFEVALQDVVDFIDDIASKRGIAVSMSDGSSLPPQFVPVTTDALAMQMIEHQRSLGRKIGA